ncbi:MAG: flagellar biosynthetic protein FliR [Acidobacteriota bacterium]
MPADLFSTLAELVMASSAWWATTFIVFMRVGAVFTLFPITGSASIAAPARLGAGLMYAILVAGLIGPLPGALPAGAGALALLLARELLVGAVVGFLARCVLAGLEFSAEIASRQMGLNLSATLDPANNSPVTPLTSFQRLLVAALFFALGGHHLLMVAMVRSYDVLPIGSAVLGGAGAATLARAVSGVIETGLLAAAPVVVISITVEIVMMTVGRAAPQIPMLLVGYPAKIAAGYFGMALALQSMPRLTTAALTSFGRMSQHLMTALAGGM